MAKEMSGKPVLLDVEEERRQDGLIDKGVANLSMVEFQKRGLPHVHIGQLSWSSTTTMLPSLAQLETTGRNTSP